MDTNTGLDMLLQYLTVLVAVVGLYFLVGVLLIVKSAKPGVLAARLFLDTRFFVRTLGLVILVALLVTLNVAAMYFGSYSLDALTLLLAMSCVAVLGYLWQSKFKRSLK